ncbi:hypothetical protein B7Z17_04380 [Candidatus Saccharibacteria bacterium 32-49-10]|nr:MAG: hypothetical protein B7Z17_04380 [Candidatus Saccharibacteria bacterium 32-49-10]
MLETPEPVIEQPMPSPQAPPVNIPVQYVAPTPIPPAAPQPQPQPTIQAPAPPAPIPTQPPQQSGSGIEFKIPEQFRDLPFQDMTLADIELAVMRQPVYDNSDMQPLNILPDPAPIQPTSPADTAVTSQTTPTTSARQPSVVVPPR